MILIRNAYSYCDPKYPAGGIHAAQADRHPGQPEGQGRSDRPGTGLSTGGFLVTIMVHFQTIFRSSTGTGIQYLKHFCHCNIGTGTGIYC